MLRLLLAVFSGLQPIICTGDFVEEWVSTEFGKECIHFPLYLQYPFFMPNHELANHSSASLLSVRLRAVTTQPRTGLSVELDTICTN